jgi:two-component system, chemotaxis family, chemotaxis protein CheY
MPKNLLIVDDSLIIRRMIERNLDKTNFDNIFTANNGKSALEICQQQSIDLITMDITMPEMDGLSCIENILKINPKLSILVISALADKATAVQAIKIGAEDFLLKPFTAEQLNLAIKELTEA